MLVLVVLSSALSIPLHQYGLAYEETLNNFISMVSNGTDLLKPFMGDFFSFLSDGSNIIKFDDYSSFTIHYWDEVVNDEKITQYLIIGYRTGWSNSEKIVYCTIEGVESYDFTWSWKHFYRMMNLRTSTGSIITSVGRNRYYRNYGNAQELSDYMATVPELASYREIFEAGR